MSNNVGSKKLFSKFEPNIKINCIAAIQNKWKNKYFFVLVNLITTN